MAPNLSHLNSPAPPILILPLCDGSLLARTAEWCISLSVGPLRAKVFSFFNIKIGGRGGFTLDGNISTRLRVKWCISASVACTDPPVKHHNVDAQMYLRIQRCRRPPLRTIFVRVHKTPNKVTNMHTIYLYRCMYTRTCTGPRRGEC